MEIREATEADIPSIITLLKQSLGESLMPKSEGYWQWKHIANPFGVSPVLLCFEKEVLIGVRAFMQWKWTNGERVYRALRAVDTATHPDQQGKGIFKKLTLSLLDICKEKGYDFVFNTPNEQSKPGYLKMGWIEAGKLPIRANIDRPMNMMLNLVMGPKLVETEESSIKYYLNHPMLDDLLASSYREATKMVTLSSSHYLRWRYIDVPVARYVAVGEENDNKLNGLIIGRIKNMRWGRELRITDYFWRQDIDLKKLVQKLKGALVDWKIDYITSTGTNIQSAKLLNGINLPFGPTVTLRKLNLTRLDDFSRFSNWSPTIGDLELF
jgi:N-acetylglutamate synthase-like GNAT family acetyltransferase